MKISRKREVIVEIEHVTLLRKRAGTALEWCGSCHRSTDFIALVKASDLFGITPSELLAFARQHHCHFIVEDEGEIHLCLVDLLSAMSRKTGKDRPNLLTGSPSRSRPESA